MAAEISLLGAIATTFLLIRAERSVHPLGAAAIVRTGRLVATASSCRPAALANSGSWYGQAGRLVVKK